MIALVDLTFVAMLGGVRLEETLSVQGAKLELASCGVRDTLWMDHYAAGLYLPPGASPQVVRDREQPKAVRMKVIDAQHFPERIPEKWRGVLKRELKEEPMARVRQIYDRLSDGDVVTITYLPEDAVTMRVNGRVVASGLQHKLITEMLDAWAEDDPISGKLQRLTFDHPC